MCTVSVEQVSETPTDAILLVHGEIDAKGEEERPSERTGESL
jgi:hypothetical protein